ncbi:RHS repeat-associated core domain-containing protein [Bradyrhizobium sp. INPA03-11B]|uniref:RHS repeat domain-containing protein n=1 Tax=Bradyrhizobium sp. INPA03-11B TaxID=418598 RepID=UPI00339044B1
MIDIVKPSVAVALALLLASPAFAAGTITRTSSFAYDAQGVLIQEVVEPDTPALRLQIDYGRDGFGNKVSVTASGVDIASRAALSSFDAKGQFVSSNTNALNQSESFQYDARFGQPTSHSGPNGLTTTWSYDGFGRKVQEILPDGTQTKWTYQFCSGINGGAASCVTGAVYQVQATPYAADGATVNGPVVIVYFDMLDREITSQTQGFDGGAVMATKTYDALGRLSKVSRPSASGAQPQLTTMTYDGLGRATQVTKPDGSASQTAYHGLTVTETNALSQTRTSTRNSQGNVISITDALGKTMAYGYDAVGQLVSTTDAEGNVTATAYDLRGRKTSGTDPDLGSSTYVWDTLSELVSQTDAKSQTTTLAYDKLGRVVRRAEVDMTSEWTYDTAANGIGKLASSSITAGPGAGFSRAIGYDALGRASQVATTIDGTTYTMSAAYDTNGRPAKVTYPSGFAVRYGYTSLGYSSQLLDDASGQPYWTANATDAVGHLTQETAGNGIVTSRSFDATTGRLLAIGTGTGNAVQSLAFTWDALGNPLSRSDANTNLNETFGYDALNRLTSTTVNLTPTPLAKTFSYSPVGNILSKSDVGTYSYPAPGSAQPHAVTSISGGTISTTFSYDANGNQIAGLGRSISWTSYNKPASITQGTRTISFLDDTAHQRFKQVTPEGTTLYISAFGVMAEITSPGAPAQRWTEYLSVSGSLVGMRSTASATTALRYFHTDHLGSISVITNESGAVVERLSYDAWGKRRNPNGSDDPSGGLTSQTNRGFTGEEQLSVAGLVHLNGRVYDPLTARMTSADSIVPNAADMQAWNAYSYVNNRPGSFTDPSGHDPVYTLPEIIVGPPTPVPFIIGGSGGGGVGVCNCEWNGEIVYLPGLGGGSNGGSLSAASSMPRFSTAGLGGLGGSFNPVAAHNLIAAATNAAADYYRSQGYFVVAHPSWGVVEVYSSPYGNKKPAQPASGSSSGAQPSSSPAQTSNTVPPAGGGMAVGGAVRGGQPAASTAGGGSFWNQPVPTVDDYGRVICSDCQTMGSSTVTAATFVGGLGLAGLGLAAVETALVADSLVVDAGVEFGTVLRNGTVAGASPLGAAPNLARLGAKFGINANSEVGANILQNLNTPVANFIAQNRLAGILREFPGQYLNKTVGQALQEGGSTVRKLLLDSRFAKQ